MITRLLVANRGEIARRVFRTCRDLGIETVAVHSDADAHMPFVAEADVAVRLPGSTPAQTYLRGELVIEAARRTGADAIHPGYGFGSENADFARAVLAAGLVWVGPAPESIERMGSKIEAKKLMDAAGVPVLGNADADTATEADLPLLVKASAGGGGRGMRIVRSLDRLAAEVAAAGAEAASAFGDGTVFVEPYVEDGRHIEVQVLGTAEGTVVLGERDCSVQRRHQKVIEEAPAPGLPAATRTALHAAAKAAAEAIDYRGAGTVEFLYDPARDRFYFLEMNTRLQVEHPVTEAVHGVDLVALQVAVAEGRTPDLADVVAAGPRGHAIEVRLYAEDPAAGYQPQSGVITAFDIPGVSAEFAGPQGFGVRLDSGVGAGDEIGTFYDAMIAKVIVHAPTREQALRQLAGTLRRARLHGLRTNRDLLVELLGHPRVVEGTMSTTFLDTAELAALEPGVPGTVVQQASALFAATVAWVEHLAARRPVQRRMPRGWRNVHADVRRTTFEVAGTEVEVGWVTEAGRYRLVDGYGEVDGVTAAAVTRTAAGWRVVVERDGLTTPYDVAIAGERLDVDGAGIHLALRKVPRFVDPATQVAAGSLLAPMPGSVVVVHTEVGDVVAEGQPLLVMEAMKMQHTVAAPCAGTVVALPASAGQQVEAGTVLAVVEAEGAPSDATEQGETA
ncbi:ATP-grasp domain-containing protein [Nocardioides sp. zg-536]|uniref:ATP-grasp domain-containing protein n=1 Tax=Nocardioides faecalis TaxID=2803858 RepID=A0A939BYE4_9ACTN|nr:biotin carboxylase N-terminal domain-containing protein [Nocardioides faecalis]MBM9459850.1 ATP-grasp domain-containing protein [Nocardioides faecalis]QVI58910.1 ATP-grasp domain-containing protein [Nocardioides faecalis]